MSLSKPISPEKLASVEETDCVLAETETHLCESQDVNYSNKQSHYLYGVFFILL